MPDFLKEIKLNYKIYINVCKSILIYYSLKLSFISISLNIYKKAL